MIPILAKLAETTENTEEPNFFVSAWNKIVDFFTNNVWGVVAFFSTLAIGLILIKVIMMVLRRVLQRKRFEPVAGRFLCAIVRFFLWLILLLVLLGILGVSISGLTTAFSAVILAIGMALKEFLSNVAAGIILVGSKKYKEGDYIQLDNVEGSIVDINFLFTTLKTPDGKQVTIPNSNMTNRPVTNLGAYPRRRVTITFSVAYESDCELVAKVVTDVMKSNGKVYLDPSPACRLKELGESSLNFFSTCWCDKEDYWDVYFYIMENVYNELKRAGINVPFKQVEIRNHKDTGDVPYMKRPLPERVEKERKYVPKKLTYSDYELMSLGELRAVAKESENYRKSQKEIKRRKKAMEKERKAKEAAEKKKAKETEKKTEK